MVMFKEMCDIFNIFYFGELVYIYLLKQGIDDGFFVFYKVVWVLIFVDDSWWLIKGLIDKYGYEVEDCIYNLKDYDCNFVIDGWIQVVVKCILDYFKQVDWYVKIIVFCVDIDYVNCMWQVFINENVDFVVKYLNYVVKIIGDDEIGKCEFDNFMDVEECFLVIVIIFKMFIIGVDIKMVKFIVLEVNIGFMIEFKQIIGWGMCIWEVEGKVYFIIMDFCKVINLFVDFDFDGELVQIYELGLEEDVVLLDVVEDVVEVVVEVVWKV